MNILKLLRPYLIWPPQLLTVVCLLVLTSCTMKSLYLQLDWLIPQFISEYIPLDDKQEQALKLRLQKTLIWHRHTQLPEYANWLRTFQKEVPQGLTETRVLQHYKQLELFWKILLAYLADDTAVLLFSINKKQQEQLFKTFERKNSDFKKAYIEPQDDIIRSNLLIQITEEYERWIGHIEPPQQLLILEAINKLKPTGVLHLQNRLILQNKLKNILNTAKSFEQLQHEIKNLFSQWEQLRSDEYQGILVYNQTILVRLTSNISKTLNNEQKIYLIQKLEYYIKLFDELRKNND